MPTDFTQNNLISFIYNETDPVQSLLIEEAISTNYQLKEEFDMLSDTKSLLDSISYQPSAASIDLVLAIGELNQPMGAQV